MAVDIYPYSGRQSGRVSDTEHEALWSPIDDGLLPGSTSGSMNVFINGGQWFVGPGRFHISGHVVEITNSPVSGNLPTAAAAQRVSWICVYVNRNNSPWTKGVMLQSGTPGSGAPTLSKSATGLYQVGLRKLITDTTGASSLGDDERPFLSRVGLPTLDTDKPMWRGYLGSSDTGAVSSGGWRHFGILAQDFGYNGAWGTAGHSSIRRIPHDGVYRIYAVQRFGGAADSGHGEAMRLRVVRNPSIGSVEGGDVLAFNGQPRNQNRAQSVDIQLTARLNKDDLVGFQREIEGAASLNVFGGTGNSYIEIEYVRAK